MDRFVLNANFGLRYSPGGFRSWWRLLNNGSDKDLDNAHLMRMAGRFARRLRAYAEAHRIPVMECSSEQRKHQIAEQYLEEHPRARGLFLILVSRAMATVWEVQRSKQGVICNLEAKRAFINHYSFHILDPDWGHVTIKMAGHPPFGVQIILNGHEYVASQARCKKIGFTKEGNCFTIISKAAELAKVADTLSEARTVGRLSQLCVIVTRLRHILERFLGNLYCMDAAFVSDNTLDELPKPSQVGHTRVGGIDVNKPRTRAVLSAALVLAFSPDGFTAGQFAATVQSMLQGADPAYSARRAAYDLKKLRGKNLVSKIAKSRRYRVPPPAIRTMGALVLLREKVLRPILSAVRNQNPTAKPINYSDIDQHYQAVRQNMLALLGDLRIAA